MAILLNIVKKIQIASLTRKCSAVRFARLSVHKNNISIRKINKLVSRRGGVIRCVDTYKGYII